MLWNFTVLGEAAGQLPGDFKANHPEVDWLRPSQLRNRIVHGYWSIDLRILHATAVDDLPGFVTALREVLAVVEVPSVGVPECARGLQVEHVVLLAVVGEPHVPGPRIGKYI